MRALCFFQICVGKMLGHLAHHPPRPSGAAARARHVMKSRWVRARVAAHVGEEPGERDYFDSATILRQLGLIPALTVAW